MSYFGNVDAKTRLLEVTRGEVRKIVEEYTEHVFIRSRASGTEGITRKRGRTAERAAGRWGRARKELYVRIH